MAEDVACGSPAGERKQQRDSRPAVGRRRLFGLLAIAPVAVAATPAAAAVDADGGVLPGRPLLEVPAAFNPAVLCDGQRDAAQVGHLMAGRRTFDAATLAGRFAGTPETIAVDDDALSTLVEGRDDGATAGALNDADRALIAGWVRRLPGGSP